MILRGGIVLLCGGVCNDGGVEWREWVRDRTLNEATGKCKRIVVLHEKSLQHEGFLDRIREGAKTHA